MLGEIVQASYSKIANGWSRVYNSPWNVKITIENTLGEGLARKVKENPVKAQAISDTAALVGYGFFVGTLFDTAAAHLTPEGWLAARGTSLFANGIWSVPYGVWANLSYRMLGTNKQSSATKKYLTDLFTCLIGQAPLVFGIYAAATFMEGGAINWTKIYTAMFGFVLSTPFLGPTMNWTLRKGREYCEIPLPGATETISPKYQECTAQSPATGS